MKSSDRKSIVTIFFILYFTISIVEITAEYFNDKNFIWVFKPLLMPLLIGYYYYLSNVQNSKFILALALSWSANMFFILEDINYIVIGSVFFLLYRMIVIYLIVDLEKKTIKLPLLIGSIPFFFIYATTAFMTFEELGSNIYIFLTHGVFIIFLGGYSLGNYIIYCNKINLILFISSMLFAFSQFVFVVKLYSDYDNELHACAMLFFVIAQFLLTRYIYLKEKPKHKYEFVNSNNEL
ncbi:lysoplasmalogenase family protein [Flavobacterium sp.]